MASKPLDVEHLLEPHRLASDIASKWQEWNSLRNGWIEEKKELRNYVYATDTRTTGNARLPWANSTTTPKLCQIYDNLKANYSAALFPKREWMRWEGSTKDSSTQDKVKTIQGYMNTKVRQSKFETTADRLVDDFILYGNCFATVEFARETATDAEGDEVSSYVGPRLVRISPYDIVFNPSASSFEHTSKVIRSIVSLGEIAKEIEEGDTEKEEVFSRMLTNRQEVAGNTSTEKSDGFVADGFSNIQHYYGSHYVEILTFYGDIYDTVNNRLETGRKITIVDRAYVLNNEPIASWLGSAPVFHSGWRNRPDNLYAMGPLDNLVGMQYRIDHLENLKADVFDQIALPMLKIRGDVEDFDQAPGSRIYMGDEGDVAPLVPDATALNADLQIQVLENKMEEMAGAPRQAMGIRTPGEKTAFEIQSLQNAAGRIFQHKAAKFEAEFIEPILNAMLEAARRNLDVNEEIKALDPELGELFKTITKEDIVAKGTIVPVGARHFAERAQRVQDINQLLQIKADPTVGVHLSGKKIAEIIAEELGEEALYGENIAVQEQLETQSAAQDAEAQNLEELEVAAEEGI